ncbi:phosphocarrier protein HPr, partial [Staphylococcus aureus]
MKILTIRRRNVIMEQNSYVIIDETGIN